MGREAQVRAEWRGASGPAKVLLESRELILRGGVRARIPRADISRVETRGGRLILDCAGETLVIDFGFDVGIASGSGRPEGDAGDQARRWATAILTPPPTLASKLGVAPDRPAYLLGPLDDAELRRALEGATTEESTAASSIVAVIEHDADLRAAVEFAERHPELPLWCVYSKGSGAPITGAEVREELRARGYIDTKASAVSARLTATRYARRGGSGS